MLTAYERSRLNEALDWLREGLCPRNPEEVAQILERLLDADDYASTDCRERPARNGRKSRHQRH